MILPLEGPGCVLVVELPAPFLKVEPPSEAEASLLDVEPPAATPLPELERHVESPAAASLLDLELLAETPLLNLESLAASLKEGPIGMADSIRIAACAHCSSSGEM